jgi:hypothetical protein
MERLLEDLRFAARVLVKDRGFAITAILTLAVCIGANAAMFAIVHSVLLRPLPVPDAEQLVHMYNAYPGGAHGRGQQCDLRPAARDGRLQEQALCTRARRHARRHRGSAADRLDARTAVAVTDAAGAAAEGTALRRG